MACLALQVSAKNPEWLTNLPEAQQKAKADGRLVLLDFTGSDWCPYCMQLKKEVFDTTEFKEFADKNLVLVVVDFPRQKPQTEEQQRVNAALQEHYRVNEYPTLVVLDSRGKQVGELTYMPGGPYPYITRLKKFKAKAEHR